MHTYSARTTHLMERNLLYDKTKNRYGAWCYCGNSTVPTPANADPVSVGRDGVVPNMDGKTFFMVDADTQDFISFAYTDAPPGETGSTEWMRACKYTSHSPAGIS